MRSSLPPLPDEAVARYTQLMQDESYLGFWDMLAFALPKPKRVTAPLLVLGGSADTIFLPNEVKATARAYQTEAVILAGMAHDLMLDVGWERVAERIVNWLQNR